MAKRISPEVKALLLELGKIQNLLGKANTALHNDRDPLKQDKCSRAIDKAFNACIEALGKYPPQS